MLTLLTWLISYRISSPHQFTFFKAYNDFRRIDVFSFFPWLQWHRWAYSIFNIITLIVICVVPIYDVRKLPEFRLTSASLKSLNKLPRHRNDKTDPTSNKYITAVGYTLNSWSRSRSHVELCVSMNILFVIILGKTQQENDEDVWINFFKFVNNHVSVWLIFNSSEENLNNVLLQLQFNTESYCDRKTFYPEWSPLTDPQRQ